jgi:hypothetical protein
MVMAEDHEAATSPHGFGMEWVMAWNNRDLEAVLSHYAEDCEVCCFMSGILLLPLLLSELVYCLCSAADLLSLFLSCHVHAQTNMHGPSL